jgi:hypothetical protein
MIIWVSSIYDILKANGIFRMLYKVSISSSFLMLDPVVHTFVFNDIKINNLISELT